MNGARILGVVLAGGQSRRFGSDKALALIGGRTLLDRAVATLERQCDAVVVAGRDDAPVAVVADRPQAGMGPLGGLNAALHHAAANGFDAVLSIPVDGMDLPDDLIGELSPGPAHCDSAPVIGLWPVGAGPALDALMATAEPRARSMRAFACAIGARAVPLSRQPFNINTPADRAAAQEPHHGL
ncbi:molybdenum cofactor guanylyltransferase [Novosphingobium sp.]|uniref:molybdenum cofactor guanylyltransferase n=1 Tax=Novosphingobium sp. TaxID=1874826 RepID=UPI00333FEDC4